MRVYIAAAIVGLALIISFALIASSVKYRNKSAETIVVTGLAEKDFNSDLIVWTGSYSRKSMDLKGAYASLKEDENQIRQYLVSKGVPAEQIIFSSVNLNKEFDTRYDENGRQVGNNFTGYNLMQTVKVESSDVNKIEALSREATQLIQQGIEFNSQPPYYYYSKLSDIKIDLLGKASADARQRAESIAKNSGASLGKLRKATMGVFQITGKNSNENYSYGGVFNTMDKLKTGSITIRMEFATD